ncbi:hypothetical protein TWF128_012097 [Orbilia oligospora]|nr:hypothetical protein TWF128_012097 [Orbilia oligospora]
MQYATWTSGPQILARAHELNMPQMNQVTDTGGEKKEQELLLPIFHSARFEFHGSSGGNAETTYNM